SATENNDNNNDSESVISEFQWFCHDIENLLKENDPILNNTVASFLQSCNWDAGQRMHQGRPRESRRKLVGNIEEQELDESVMSAQLKRPKKQPYDLQQAILENRPNGVA
ncbi:2246_t:CDS:2, partial [Dentiscutata heterogama]